MFTFNMKFGDTNFIGVANAEKYASFVDKDWQFESLLQHFEDEMKNGHIMVFQMTNEGIEHSWKVHVTFNEKELSPTCFRKAIGYMKVTEGKLYLVDYDCLTMAAQFEDERIPDKNCSKYQIDIENGFYKVEFIQYYDVDENRYTGGNACQVMINFIKQEEFTSASNRVFFCTYY